MKLGKIVLVVGLLAVAAYLYNTAPRQDTGGTGANVKTDINLPRVGGSVSTDELNGYWSEKGIQAVGLDFSAAALAESEWQALKEKFSAATGKADSKATAELAGVYASMADAGLNEEAYNARVARIDGLAFSDYCSSLALFRERDGFGAKRLQALKSYALQYGNFLAEYPNESERLGFAELGLDVAAEEARHVQRLEAVKGLETACGGV
ncbi:MAG: hypothetical protein J4203_05495 [Candidatus Diapherotrites archaeon]|uniref:Uncharacterized protein n=2 Tax=Candidatus Iainarchaeum sp. TaxID=3101447 RepID=A0A8T4L9E6_9ARCH|nr:hypothetical protein [Candidatus Diapherotrites archaeon]